MSDDVSRETTPDPGPVTPSVPDVARRVFPSGRLPLVVRYAELLATEAVVRGLIGPREAPRLWERHLLNSAVMAEAVPEGATVCNVGTGAGLPGLVLAIARDDLTITLVEPLLRRTTFLQEVVDELALDHVEVMRGRAEELHGRRTFDVVTSRAVAPLDRLLRWCMPLVAPQGAMVAMKGALISEEIEAARGVLKSFKAAEPEVIQVGADLLESPTRVVRVAWADPARVGWSPPSSSSSRRGGRRSRSRRS